MGIPLGLAPDDYKKGELSSNVDGGYFAAIAKHGENCEHVGNVRARVVFGDPIEGVIESYECAGEFIKLPKPLRTYPYPHTYPYLLSDQKIWEE